MKIIAISGISGFVGSALYEFFERQSYKIIPIPRSALLQPERLREFINGVDVLINLSGASILHRWSESYKKTLYTSRIDTTKALVNAIASCKDKPKLFISTSAIGIYKNDAIYDEDATTLADDFLANLCKDWEHEALKATHNDIRTVIFLSGVVMGAGGGAFSKMITPFRLGLGGAIGDGRQAFSFIHIQDLLRAYQHVIADEELHGIFNLTTPHPTTNQTLTKTLAKHLHRPALLPIPAFILGLLFGEGAKILTDGQSILPNNLLKSGFAFSHPSIDETVQALV